MCDFSFLAPMNTFRDSLLREVKWAAAVDFGMVCDSTEVCCVDFFNVQDAKWPVESYINWDLDNSTDFTASIRYSHSKYHGWGLVATGTEEELIFLQKSCQLPVILVRESELSNKTQHQQISGVAKLVGDYRNSFYRAFRTARKLQLYQKLSKPFKIFYV